MTRRFPLPTAPRRPVVFSTTCVAALLLVAGWAPAARAADFTWNNAAGGNWNVGGNWTPAGPPAAADNATVGTAGTYTVALTDDRAITNLTVNNATATLNHTAGTFTVSGTVALTAGTYSLNGGTVSSSPAVPGRITSGGGLLRLQDNNANRLNNVVVGVGVLDFGANQGRVRLQGSTTLAAGTVLNLSAVGNVLAFEQTATANNLTVNMTGTSGFVSVEGNNTLTLGPATTITHNSASSGTITSGVLVGGNSGVINQGLIRTTGSGLLTIQPGTFLNQAGGIVRAAAGSILIPGGINLNNFNSGTLTNGTWEVQGSATLNLGGRNIATLAAGTTVAFDGANPTFAALDSLTTNAGTLRVLGGKTFTPTAAVVANTGLIQVGPGSTFGKPIAVQSGGRLEGTGTVTGGVTVGGTATVPGAAAPGTAAAPVGTLTTGGQTWAGGGAYEISYDQITGTFVAGTDNDLLNGPGALTVTATPANKFRIRMHYTGTETSGNPAPVTLRIASFGGGVPAGFDLNAFQLEGSLFAGGSAFNLTSSGTDVFLTFTPVPEPATVLLIGAAGLGATVLVRRSRRMVAGMRG